MVGFEPTIWDPYKWAPCLPTDIIITSILYYKYTILLDTLQKIYLFCASSGEMGNYTALKGAFRGERFSVFAFQRTLDKVAHLVCSILCFVVFAIEIELNGDHRLWICAINDASKGVVGGSVGKFKSVFCGEIGTMRHLNNKVLVWRVAGNHHTIFVFYWLIFVACSEKEDTA